MRIPKFDPTNLTREERKFHFVQFVKETKLRLNLKLPLSNFFDRQGTPLLTILDILKASEGTTDLPNLIYVTTCHTFVGEDKKKPYTVL